MKITITNKFQPISAKVWIYVLSDPDGQFICQIREDHLKGLLSLIRLEVNPGKVFCVEQTELYSLCLVWGRESGLIIAEPGTVLERGSRLGIRNPSIEPFNT
jgi:hypothetical protein